MQPITFTAKPWRINTTHVVTIPWYLIKHGEVNPKAKLTITIEETP